MRYIFEGTYKVFYVVEIMVCQLNNYSFWQPYILQSKTLKHIFEGEYISAILDTLI